MNTNYEYSNEIVPLIVTDEDRELVDRELICSKSQDFKIASRILRYLKGNDFRITPRKITKVGVQKGREFCIDSRGTGLSMSKAFIDAVSPPLIAGIIESHESLPKLTDIPQEVTDRHKPQVSIMEEHGRAIDMTFPAISRNVFNSDIVVYNETTDSYRKLKTEELNAPHIAVLKLSNLAVPKDFARDYVRYQASEREYNPARIVLESFENSIDMDVNRAKEIVFGFASKYFFNDEEIANTVWGHFLVATARLHLGIEDAMPPEFVPILSGDQGCYKSSAITMLFDYCKDQSIRSVVTASPEKFFSDITLRSTAAVMEFPEIENWLNLKNLNSFKAAVTDAFPEGRRPYDSAPTKWKRMSVWVGTTNNPDCVLIDRTSSYDRRFIPIRIASGTFIDTEAIESDRSLIWAAAVKLVRENILIRPHSLPSSLFAKLFEYQEEFFEECPLQDGALAYARGSNIVNPKHAMLCVFGQEDEDINTDQLRDVKAIYKKYLPSMGFEKQKVRLENGTRPYCYVRKVQLTDEQITEARKEVNTDRRRSIAFDELDDF